MYYWYNSEVPDQWCRWYKDSQLVHAGGGVWCGLRSDVPGGGGRVWQR